MYATLKNFDLVLDDSWSNGLPAIENRYLKGQDLRQIMPRHYSIKSFRENLDYNNYYQIVKTASREVRCVSRPIIPSYEDHQYLGVCAYCRELKFFLQQHYDDIVYEKILALHKTYECYPTEWYEKTKKIRDQFNLVKPKWIRLARGVFKLIEGSIIIDGVPIRRRLDDQLFPNLYSVELRKEHLQNVSVIISNDEYLSFVMLSAQNIYKYEDEELFIMERKTKEVYQIQDSSVDYVIDRVKKMKYSEKARKEKSDQIRKDLKKNRSQCDPLQYVRSPAREAYERNRSKCREKNKQRYQEVRRPYDEN